MLVNNGNVHHLDPDFCSLLERSIRKGLGNVIGESGAHAVITNFHLEKHIDIPSELHLALFSAFQSPGTIILERAIVKNLFETMGEKYDSKTEDFDLEKAVAQAEYLFMRKRRTED